MVVSVLRKAVRTKHTNFRLLKKKIDNKKYYMYTRIVCIIRYVYVSVLSKVVKVFNFYHYDQVINEANKLLIIVHAVA